MEAKGKGLVEHWNWAAEKGLMNKNTAGSWRAACTQVLGAIDNWQDADLETLDIQDTVKRFKNLRKRDFKPKSLEVYKKRFEQAVASYLSYLEDPGNWRPVSRDPALRPERNGSGGFPEEASSNVAREGSKTSLVDYPFPLREGQTVRLLLPRDLKTAEVRRLNAFMTTLAIDFGEVQN